MTMTNHESHAALDLCPMCDGEGTHTLKAPDGKVYRIVRVAHYLYEGEEGIPVFGTTGQIGTTGGSIRKQESEKEFLERHETVLNDLASKGYDVIQMTEDPSRTFTVYMLQFRWR